MILTYLNLYLDQVPPPKAVLFFGGLLLNKDNDNIPVRGDSFSLSQTT